MVEREVMFQAVEQIERICYIVPIHAVFGGYNDLV